jgi:subtilisin family serine protease
MLTVSLAAPSAQPVNVGYVVTGSATAGADYRLLTGADRLSLPTGRLTFAPGETVKRISVMPINDSLREGDEQFTFTLRPIGGITIVNRAATVMILDDDTYDVQIEPVAQGSMLVPGQPNEFVMRLVHRGQVVPATRTERFYLSTRDGSAVAGSDYLPLDRLPVTFAPGQSERRFRVMVVDNPRDANGQYERFENVFTITTDPFDPAVPTPQQVNFAVIGREPPPPALRVIAPSRPEGNEGLTEFVFTVQLDRWPTQVVTVNYATADGSAIRNEDYQPTSGVLRFGVGEMSKTVSVMVIGDRREESDETFSLVLSNPLNATIPPGAGIGVAMILDDDRGELLQRATFTADVGWGVVDASAAVASVLGRETAFPRVDNPRDVNWANNLIRAPSVWEQGITGRGITVAVIDSGVDYNHPALSQRIVLGADYIDGDLNPMDEVFFVSPGRPDPGSGHGTHVAGTIVAAPNRYGPAGVAYESQVLAIRVFPSRGGASSSDVNAAIRFAADSGAHVINLSLGIDAIEGELPGGVVSPWRAAIEYAVSRGSIVIVAAGNDGRLSPEFPAWLAQTPGVISVGAIDRNELRAPFSSQAGPNDRMKHVVAPGVGILSTMPQVMPAGVVGVIERQGGKYAQQNGTSMAAPHVSGVVALMLSALPDPRAPGVQELVVSALIDTARRPARTGAASEPATPAPQPTPPQLAAGSRAAVDLTGNGVTDLIWQSADGAAVAWIDGNPDRARLLGGGGGWSLAATGDFNGDGVSDLVWRNSAGQYVLWVMEPAGGSSMQRLLGGGGGWSLEATGDYNGDGKTDLVWRNGGNGVNVMWLMDGATAMRQTVIGGDHTWRLVASDERFDANGDGRTDLIWRHAASGANVLWTMHGGTAIATRALGGDHTWQITGAGDFDGDGRGDLLWRNTVNGAVVMHLLDDGQVRQSRLVGGDLTKTVAGTTSGTAAAIYWRELGGAIVRESLVQGSAQVTRLGGDTVWRLLGRPGQVA